MLSVYKHIRKFCYTGEHKNADAFSQVSLRGIPAQTETPADFVLFMEHLADSPVTAKQTQVWTRLDTTLVAVLPTL